MAVFHSPESGTSMQNVPGVICHLYENPKRLEKRMKKNKEAFAGKKRAACQRRELRLRKLLSEILIS